MTRVALFGGMVLSAGLIYAAWVLATRGAWN